MTRVTKALIGKDIARTASIVNIYDGTTKPADGEILVLDKDKKPLAAGATVADSDVIYLCQGTSATYDYTNDAGTTVTGARVLKFSDPIEGKLVKGYRATPYAPAIQRQTTFAAITSPLTAGTEYVLRIVYKDVVAKRGQFTKTYRFISPLTTSVGVFNGLRLAIAADKGARITANAQNAATLILTAKAIPEGNTSVNDIDTVQLVDFDAFLNYVDANDLQQTCTGSTQTKIAAEYGSGTWQLVRDLEKNQLGYEGILDQTTFPLVSHSLSTVAGAVYNQIIIEHDKSYLSPDNQYVKQAPMTTVIALPVGALQTTDILGVLNPWMASAGLNAINF